MINFRDSFPLFLLLFFLKLGYMFFVVFFLWFFFLGYMPFHCMNLSDSRTNGSKTAKRKAPPLIFFFFPDPF